MKIAGTLLLSLALLLPANAQHADEGRYKDLGHKMMCTCGQCQYVLLECNHVGCQSSTQMIKELKINLDKGMTNDEVLDWFRQTYGPTAVIVPKTSGFELTIWVVPPVLSGLAILLVFFLVRRWRARAALDPSPGLNPRLDEFRARARQETEL